MEEEYYNFYQERRYSYITSPTPDYNKFPLYYTAEKEEYIIEAGQCLFIPKFYFHIVIAEEVDEKTQLNVSACYFYPSKNDISPHVINHKIDLDPMNIFPKDKILEVTRTKGDCFLSNFVRRKFPYENTYLYMTFDEFYETKNKKLCIIDPYHEFDKAPLHTVDANTCQIRMNFGKGTCCMLHCDGMDSAVCQIQGRKRILVFPPSERDKLYIMNPYNTELIDIIHRNIVQDKYVRINTGIIDKDIINDIIYTMKPDKIKTLKSSTITNLYIKQQKYYAQSMIDNNENIWYDQVSDLPESFVVMDTETGVPERVIDCMDSSITVLFALTKGIIKINNVEHTLSEGDSICFPSSITHPWMPYKNMIIMFPNFNKE